ncbi:MAG: HEPN domain-containing protein [Microcystis sp.]
MTLTEAQIELLLKARQSAAAAQVLLDNNYPEFAVSRAYYAMFYVAEAFLEGQGLSFSPKKSRKFVKEIIITSQI